MVAFITSNALVTVIPALDRGLISAALFGFVACSAKCERSQASLSTHVKLVNQKPKSDLFRN